MNNGPDLWEKILSHFPEESVIAGGAIRDYFLGVEPKDFDVFGPYANYDPGIEGMHHLDYEVDSSTWTEEYLAMREIAIVMKGEIEGVNVDYIGHHLPDAVHLVESFDTGINQLFYGRGGVLFKKKAHLDDIENKTVTVVRGDRMERTKQRFERFNTKMNGTFKLVIPEGLEIQPESQDDFDPFL